MRISEAGKQFIKDAEKLSFTAYLDSKGIPTIGWGHTKDVRMGDVINEDRAEEYLSMDLYDTELAVNRLTFAITQNQYDALVSLTFNVGIGAFSKSTLLKKLNKFDIMGAANEFINWRDDGRPEEKGLLNRRVRERDLFLTAD